MHGAVVVPLFAGEGRKGVGEGVGGPFEIGRPRSRGWKNFGRRWTRWVGVLEN